MKVDKTQKAAIAAKHNKSKAAIAAATAAHKAAQVSGVAKSVKVDVSKRKAKAIAYNGLTGECVLLVSGNRGEVYRRVNIAKDGSTKHNYAANTGLRIDGATFNITAVDKLNRDQRKELGTYVAERGSKATFTVLSMGDAIKRCKHGIECERNGHKVQKLVSRKDTFYAASLERIGKAVVFGQSEARKLAHAHKNHVSSIERDLSAKETATLAKSIAAGINGK